MVCFVVFVFVGYLLLVCVNVGFVVYRCFDLSLVCV